MSTDPDPSFENLALRIKTWGHALGFQQTGIAAIDLGEDETRLNDWLREGMHGEMGYMAKHGTRRSRPAELVPGTVRVISLRMDYLPEARPAADALADATTAYVSRYALGRDYHKLIRRRLGRLCRRIDTAAGRTGHRAFVDSAPVLEKALARNAGLGWIGKHSNLIHPRAGSWFFLGEIYTNLPLPTDAPFTSSHCGQCTACMQVCPTGAIVAPYRVDARRCISYLTIELKGSIPEHLRPMIGNRIYGCDDCQLVCPWNRFARLSTEKDFMPRHGLDSAELTTLFEWDESEFLGRTEGSAIRRIGHERWLRNIAVALGNAPRNPNAVAALEARATHPSELVREHVGWALEKQKTADGRQ